MESGTKAHRERRSGARPLRSLRGDTALVGAPYDGDNGSFLGSAYVFVRGGSTWSQQQKLTEYGGAEFHFFGWSVAISGDTAVVSADGAGSIYNGSDSGSAYVFVRSATTWNQEQKLTANDGAAADEFGRSVAISGDTAVVGAHWDDDNGSDSGSAYVFVRDGSTWSQQQKLTAYDGAEFHEFGLSVAINGDTAIIGAPNDESGSAYVFDSTLLDDKNNGFLPAVYFLLLLNK